MKLAGREFKSLEDHSFLSNKINVCSTLLWVLSTPANELIRNLTVGDHRVFPADALGTIGMNFKMMPELSWPLGTVRHLLMLASAARLISISSGAVAPTHGSAFLYRSLARRSGLLIIVGDIPPASSGWSLCCHPSGVLSTDRAVAAFIAAWSPCRATRSSPAPGPTPSRQRERGPSSSHTDDLGKSPRHPASERPGFWPA